jgi:hypothetical protein
MVPYENLFFMFIGLQELQTDVQEVAAFKRTSRFGTKTGKKGNALLAEEDFVEDYISDSSRTNNVADDESEEGNSENEDDGGFKLAPAMIFLATCQYIL